ncbi:hypothetical protein KSP40_PGU004331 [Platanthera guangdongensis]|uniref:Zinc finger LSD1-type domain-containing protein n=1 Tax=Platanthera guangdongensis TaxID=2320717 RepID=A0ABR2MYH4_9ASPA
METQSNGSQIVHYYSDCSSREMAAMSVDALASVIFLDDWIVDSPLMNQSSLFRLTRGTIRANVDSNCGFQIVDSYAANQVAQLCCGHCRTTLMYPYGAPSVKCAVCRYVTNVGAVRSSSRRSHSRSIGSMRPPTPMPPTTTPAPVSATRAKSNSVTVVVENPMSVNENGKLEAR